MIVLMSEIDLQVHVSAKLYWRDKAETCDVTIGRKLRQEEINLLAAKFEVPLQMLLKELLKDHA